MDVVHKTKTSNPFKLLTTSLSPPSSLLSEEEGRPPPSTPIRLLFPTPLRRPSPSTMALRLAFISLLFAVAFSVQSSSAGDVADAYQFLAGTDVSLGELASPRTCNGLVGDCIDGEEEMEMESEFDRRQLAQARRYISYGALLKDRVPCGRRGSSYYNCNRHGRANPYNRGCSIITRCARILD